MDNLKTSHEWYLEEKGFDIIDPDGWRKDGPTMQYYTWHIEKMTHHQFMRKVMLSTIGSYNSRKHHSPFGDRIPDTLMNVLQNFH